MFAIATPAPPGGMQLPPQPKTHPGGIPRGALLLSPCIIGMGEHWGNPNYLPVGPFYGVYKGHPVFTEIMIDRKAFAVGKSFENMLKPLTGYRIDHVDVEFEPHGHEGYPIPHYDVHAYYVSHAVHMAYCPNGIPIPK